PAAAPAAPAAAAPEKPAEKPGHLVTSPFVGTFYRTPAPDQPPFVDVGTVVRKGQVLCIVEAMKLMNEIESEVSGRIAEVLVENGRPVEFGQALFRIEPA
ncbi:acetyl-CoA carboxylase biotin carboxyl carrier protein, partial [Corallococcus carmarthensis]